MDITAYSSSTKRIVAGSAVLDEQFHVVCGDSMMYQFLGLNAPDTFDMLIHPEDVSEFCFACCQAEQGEVQNIIIRVKDAKDNYCVVHFSICYAGMQKFHKKSYQLQMYDLLGTEERCEYANRNLDKYQVFMGMIQERFFEYETESGIFRVYIYINGKPILLVQMPLDAWHKKCITQNIISADDRIEFENLYMFLKRGRDEFSVQFESNIFTESNCMESLKFHGKTIYRNMEKDMVVGIITSLTGEQKQQQAYYLSEAGRDSATGLLNKRAITEYTMERLRVFRGNHRFRIIMIDIDDFKGINDTYGHMRGDEVIEKIAVVIKNVIASHGIVGRFGGDEFFIFLEEMTREEELLQRLQTICKNVSRLYAGEPEQIHITLSIGVSTCPEDGQEYKELIRKADKALYIAKEQGKNRFVIYQEKQHKEHQISSLTQANGRYWLMKSEKKAKVVAEQLALLQCTGKKELSHILRNLCECFELDGIIIYTGEELKYSYSYGQYIKLIENASYIRKLCYRRLFDENGICVVDNVAVFVREDQELYELFLSQETTSMVQYLGGTLEHPSFLITYEIFNRKHKWSQEDTNFLLIFGKLLELVI